MLEIKNLHASIDGKPILKGINLRINAGEVHAIMGPNGSGKSTLASIIAGNEAYEITQGDILFEGNSLFDLQPHQRAAAGVFLAFQYPVEIPGVSMMNFMKTAINEIRAQNGLQPMEAAAFLKLVREKQALVELDAKLANRSVNQGFSGGEKNATRSFKWPC